jgi:hypothetical protein
MLSSYFDELSSIVDAQKKEKEEGMDMRDDRPFSSMLTADEEPTEDYNPAQVGEPEPEVIVRGS